MTESRKAGRKRSIFEPEPKEKLRMVLTGIAAGIFVWWLVYRSLYFLPAVPAAAAFVYFLKKRESVDEKKRAFTVQFAEYVKALHTAMRSGYSLENAAENACGAMKDLYGEDTLICKEAARVCNGLKISRTAEELFGELGARCRVPDVVLFAELITISKRSGGDMGKLLSDTSRILDEKADTESLIQEQLAGKRMEHRVMSLMPALMILYMKLCFSGFTDVLYDTEAGVVVMTVSLVIYTAAYVWGLRMVNIRV